MQKSKWRRERLLILCYHGISLDEEHHWSPGLFLPSDYFRARLQILKKTGCNVLPLGEAIQRLYANDLPEKSVAITFDDGNYDFYEQAYPIIRDFGFPVTLYLTTFYSHYNRPVFDPMSAYLLWKAQGATLNLKELTGKDATIDLSEAAGRAAATDEIRGFARQHKLSAEEKDDLLVRLAKQLRVDYDELLAKRVLYLMTPDEVKQVAANGADIQLHTHRHRTPLDRALFRREIEDNRNDIQSMTGTRASHFCYPSGVYDPAFLTWLRELGVASATTCDLGVASKDSHPLLLPRFLDSTSLSPIEFEGWLAGVASLLPRR
ncbi:MAG: polysaccharide deacetylase family protein [Acidobacteriota bacterium]|nr:polysaccharide deacetylase family protein [Acidobacteriota bacterium]